MALGAFGAHGLEKMVDAEAINSWEVGVRYQFYHTFAIFLCLIFARQYGMEKAPKAFWFFLGGIILFSGSLYLLATASVTGAPTSVLGPITPIGGLLFMVGWVMLFLDLRKRF